VGARTAHALDLGRSSTGSALSALWKTGSVFQVDACTSEAAPLLRAFAQVPWKRSECAMANFHCEVAVYHPLPQTPCAAIGRCASRGPYVSLGGPPERLWHLRFVPNPSEGDLGLFRAATEPSPAVFGRRWAPAGLGPTEGNAES
jgi:hypothetical protein